MHQQLLKCPATIDRYFNAPLFSEREAYLQHCARQGYVKRTLVTYGFTLMEIVSELPHLSEGVTREDIVVASIRWRQKRHKRQKAKPCRRFISVATGWCRFHGWLRSSQAEGPFDNQVSEFADWLGKEKGLTLNSIQTYCFYTQRFLCWFATTNQQIAKIRIDDIDQFLSIQGKTNWSRRTVVGCMHALRSFFRFAFIRKWCEVAIADAIEGPKLYSHENIPSSPTWDEIKQVVTSMETHKVQDIRDKAIVMLCAVYGFRRGEIAELKLENIDWERNQILIYRPKQRQSQLYPLMKPVGDAIVRYLVSARPPRSSSRNIFLTVTAPARPLSPSGISNAVSKRLRQVGIECGAHSLRHACATRLVNRGHSFKEVGDFLGHNSLSHTGIYAKVNLSALRQVALSDLGGVV